KANSLGNLGNVYKLLGEYKQAIKYHQQSLKIAREIFNHQIEVNCLDNLGNVYQSLEKYNTAIQSYQQALKIAHQQDYPKEKANSLDHLGSAYYSLGKYKQAIKYHQQSLKIAKRIGDRHRQAICLCNLGIATKTLGKYQEAINYYQQSLNIAHQQSYYDEVANCLLHLGIAYNSIGLYETAFEYVNQSLKITQEIGDRQGEAIALSNLGNTFQLQRQYDTAIYYHLLSLNIAQKISDRRREATFLGNLGNAYYSKGEYDTAIRYYQQSLDIAKNTVNRREEAFSLSNLGNVYYSKGEYDTAIRYYQQSLDIAKDIGDVAGQGSSLNNLGTALLKSDRLQESHKELYSAINAWEALRHGLQEDAHRISIFEQQALTYRRLQEVIVFQNQPSEALVIAERGRARAFVYLLAERLSLASAEKISLTYPTLKQIEQIALEQESTLVEYSIVDLDKLFIWVIKPVGGEIFFRQVDLKPLEEQHSSLSNLIKQVREILGVSRSQDDAKSTASLEIIQSSRHIYQPLRLLHQFLIEQIALLLPTNPNSPVVLIPQGDLFLVPFPALQDPEGKFLIEKHNIVTAPSIQVLELTQKRSRETPETSLEAMVVGNPKMPTIPLTEPPVQLQDLAWAKTEAQAIAHFLNTQAITGADATKVRIQQLLPKARLIHLATHGLLDDIRQLGIPGALALAPSEGRLALAKSDEDNGFLTAGEIYDMKLNAELVVLSACSTGLGKITGDGVIGLSRCLIAAGVKSVIVSLWSVDDLSTALLMVKFYQIFQQGVAATVALNEAQRWLSGVTKTELSVWVNTNERFFDATLKIHLRKRLHQLDENAKLFQNPRYWAAFCAIGQ
ncbi:MAG: CHAT domain-containing tetratricopeptide repeat protein, partial [Scytonema sp. PMC 1069.18]|nr:CHAT domain-containing tetratricopeptide repeat protein [Scytonema sp. PMC 1069.18]